LLVGRHRHDELDLGFDLSRTRDNLLAKLLASKEVDVCKRRLPPEPDPRLPEDEREEALWKRAKAAATVHAVLHGVPGRLRVNKGEWQASPMCHQERCRAAGLSFTLLELCQYWDHRHRGDLRICVAEIDAHLQELAAGVPDTLKRASSKLLLQMREQRHEVLAHAAAMAKSGNSQGAAELRQAQANADRLFKDERNQLILARWLGKTLSVVAFLASALNRSMAGEMTFHRPLPSRVSAGRPKASLLSSVLQHLKRGGLERGEMMEIVAGMSGGAASMDPAAVKEQIRQRLRSDDCRTTGPFEKSDGLRPGKPRCAVEGRTAIVHDNHGENASVAAKTE
jgi:hypothetical protein